MIGGLLYTLLGVVMLVSPPADPQVLSSASDYLGEGLFVAALLLTLGGLVALHLRQAGSYGVLGKVGFYAAVVGQVALLVSAAASFAAGEDVLGPFFVLGFLLWLVGLLVLALATFRGAIFRTGALWCWPLDGCCRSPSSRGGNDPAGFSLDRAGLRALIV